MRFLYRLCLVSFLFACYGMVHWAWLALATTLLITSLHNSISENIVVANNNILNGLSETNKKLDQYRSR